MGTRPRGLRETVVRALAKVGLVWAVFVLGALFMTMSAAGQPDDAPAATGTDAGSTSFSIPSGESPRTAGLALALVLLGGGLTVLAVGATRGDAIGRDDAGHGDAFGGDVLPRYAADEPDLGSDLPLALGLGLVA